MSIVNDMGIQKIWNNPTGVQYNVDYVAAPRGVVRTAPRGSSWPAPVYGANSQQGLYGYSHNGNISSNYNTVRKMTGMWNRLSGNWVNYYPNYGWYTYWGNQQRWYNYRWNNMWGRRYSANVLDRAITDMNAWYQWTARDMEQIKRAAKNNPEYANRLLQNYKNTGTFWDNSKGIDYAIPDYDENGNYVRKNLRNPSDPTYVPKPFLRR